MEVSDIPLPELDGRALEKDSEFYERLRDSYCGQYAPEEPFLERNRPYTPSPLPLWERMLKMFFPIRG